MTPPKFNVLLVEDDAAQVALIRRMLGSFKEASFHVQSEAFLEHGLRFASVHPVDIVLLDLNLPDSWGAETVRQARSVLARVPIVVLTVMPDRDTAVEALRLGANDYLVKGAVDSHLLGRALVRQLSANRARQRPAEVATRHSRA